MAPPIDYNIIKYLNPAESVYDKFDEQARLAADLEKSSLTSQYQRLQMEQAQKALAQQAELEAAMQDVGTDANGQVDLSSALRKAAAIKARQGDVNGGAAILKALQPPDPYEAEKRKIDMDIKRGQLRKLNEPKPEKKEPTVRIREKNTGVLRIVPESQLEEYSRNGWDLASAAPSLYDDMQRYANPQGRETAPPPPEAPVKKKPTISELIQMGYKQNPNGTWSK